MSGPVLVPGAAAAAKDESLRNCCRRVLPFPAGHPNFYAPPLPSPFSSPEMGQAEPTVLHPVPPPQFSGPPPPVGNRLSDDPGAGGRSRAGGQHRRMISEEEFERVQRQAFRRGQNQGHSEGHHEGYRRGRDHESAAHVQRSFVSQMTGHLPPSSSKCPFPPTRPMRIKGSKGKGKGKGKH